MAETRQQRGKYNRISVKVPKMIHFMQGVSTKDFRERAPDLSPGEGHCLVFLYTLLPQCFALHNKVNGQKGTETAKGSCLTQLIHEHSLSPIATLCF